MFLLSVHSSLITKFFIFSLIVSFNCSVSHVHVQFSFLLLFIYILYKIMFVKLKVPCVALTQTGAFRSFSVPMTFDLISTNRTYLLDSI